MGAIAHSSDLAAAIVSCDLLSVGLDIERLGRIKEKLYDKFYHVKDPDETFSILKEEYSG